MSDVDPDNGMRDVKGQPGRAAHVRQFAVKDELLLILTDDRPRLSSDEPRQKALAVSQTGRAIWELCNGINAPDDIARSLASHYDIDFPVLRHHVYEALTDLSRLGFIEGLVEHERATIPTVFAIGIEDSPYFRWQTAILLESLQGKLPAGWQAHVVVCNDGAEISAPLRNILTAYKAKYTVATNHGHNHRIDIGLNGGRFYPAMNKAEALAVAAQSVRPSDMIFLLDSDMFLYGDLPLDIFPGGCALPRNWHVEHQPFLASVGQNGGKGIDLNKLLEAIGCESPFHAGGVNVFVTGTVARDPKFIADCFRFAHALYLLGQAAGAELTWIAEMPCFALAMTANGVSFDLLVDKQFLVSDCDEAEIPDGTFYHYYSDPKDFGRAAFKGSTWCKQAYADRDFLSTDFDHFARDATTAHERYFFELANRARRRLNA